MKDFVAPLDDILFSLNHVADAGKIEDWDAEFIGEIAQHFASFAEGELASIDEAGDRQGCRMEDGRVIMPDGFREAYQAYAEQGWQGLTAPEDYGGQALGDVVLAVTSEIFSGANHSLQMVSGLVPGAIRTILHFGTEDQKARHLPALISGETLATMCLTESGAGSDLSRVRCAATSQEGRWHINGEKIFISGGDQNISDRILHLVLARTSDDGVKGLSLFLCPCTKADGSLNDISVTRIEEKMGLHASPTCQLAFDNAEAELIGEEGRGLAAMFTMMNHARADVALQGVAHAARSYDVAKAYAAERTQGRDGEGKEVTLERHADVARMLDEIDSMAIGARAIAHVAAVTMERGNDPQLVEFLTPLAKVLGTESGIKAAELGIQVLGGYGYLQEYRLDQTYRDARITAIYEGANGIHTRSMATRLLKGEPADAFQKWMTMKISKTGGYVLGTSLGSWREARQILLEASDPTPMAEDFYRLTALVMLHAIWLKIESNAEHHPDPDRIKRLAARKLGRLPIEIYAARELLVHQTN